MNPFYDSTKKIANSSDIESQFNIVKNIIMESVRLPIRADYFVQKHLRSLNGSVKLSILKQKGILYGTHNQLFRI